MSNIKVSVDFLDGPVTGIITKGRHIAKSMANNKVFRLAPISPEGLLAAVEDLQELEKKARSGRKQDVDDRDTALSDTGDFFRQTAHYLNQGSFGKDDLLTSGFDAVEGNELSPVIESPSWSGRIM